MIYLKQRLRKPNIVPQRRSGFRLPFLLFTFTFRYMGPCMFCILDCGPVTCRLQDKDIPI